MHIFTISKFEGNIFWTEESKNTIGSNFEIKTKFMVDKNTTVVKYLYAYNSLLQHTEVSNLQARKKYILLLEFCILELGKMYV